MHELRRLYLYIALCVTGLVGHADLHIVPLIPQLEDCFSEL